MITHILMLFSIPCSSFLSSCYTLFCIQYISSIISLSFSWIIHFVWSLTGQSRCVTPLHWYCTADLKPGLFYYSDNLLSYSELKVLSIYLVGNLYSLGIYLFLRVTDCLSIQKDTKCHKTIQWTLLNTHYSSILYRKLMYLGITIIVICRYKNVLASRLQSFW